MYFTNDAANPSNSDALCQRTPENKTKQKKIKWVFVVCTSSQIFPERLHTASHSAIAKYPQALEGAENYTDFACLMGVTSYQ